MSRASSAVLAAAGGALTFVLACGAAPGTSASTSSTSPSPTARPAAGTAGTAAANAAPGPRATLPSGAVYRLELALTPEDQAQGLMYRENLPDRTGMLFVFPEEAPHHFWMKNTMIPLDMIWLDASGRVLYVNADTPPCKADPCATYGPDGPAKMVLEIAGGRAKAEGVSAGTKLEIAGVD